MSSGSQNLVALVLIDNIYLLQNKKKTKKTKKYLNEIMADKQE